MVANKTLALFIIAAVVVSLGGTLLSLNKLDELHKLKARPEAPAKLTGLASGRVQIEITSLAGCNVDQNVSFGSAATKVTSITTNRDNSVDGFNDCTDGAGANNCKGLQINNTGNENVYVNFTSDRNASTFPGGASIVASDFGYYIRNGTYIEAMQGCREIVGATSWANVNLSNNQICANLTPADGSDIMTMEFNVTLKSDTPTGQKTALITVDCNIIS